MTKFLKNVDRVRSLVRGMEADVKEIEKANERSFQRIRSRLKQKLEDLSGEITALYAFLEDQTLSPIEFEKRRTTIEDFESLQRLIENKLSVIESNPPNSQVTKELLSEEEQSLDDLLKSTGNIKRQTFDMNAELHSHNALLAEIESEVGENLGLMEKSLNGLSQIMNHTSDRCLMITLCILFFFLVFLLV